MEIKNLSLKEARMLRDRTHREVAEELNIHEQTYAKIERNPARATFEQGKKICKFLNFNIEQINFFN